jgi:hypothetical protein
MKYEDVNPQVVVADQSTVAKMARNIVATIVRDIIPTDWDAAAKRAADNLGKRVLAEMTIELNKLRMKSAR